MSEINVSVGGGPGVVVSVAGNGTTATVTTGGAVDVTLTESNPTWSGIAGKPTTFPPQAHSHAISDVTGLTAALAQKVELDPYGKVLASQLPSYVDDVLEFANLAALPATGETGKIYVTTGNGKVYRWSGSTYIEISAAPGSTDSVPEGTGNLYHTTARAAAAAPVQSVAGKTGAVTLAIADVGGLQTAIDGKAAASHGHDAATTSAAGFMAAADKSKLDGIASGATANATDAQLRDRSTHTGTQAASTITGLGGAATLNVGTTAGTVAAGNDARLTDQRVPTDGSVTDAKITAAGLSTSSLNWAAIQPWAANTAYAKGDLVSNAGIAYRRSAAGTSGATFNVANWQQITPSNPVISVDGSTGAVTVLKSEFYTFTRTSKPADASGSNGSYTWSIPSAAKQITVLSVGGGGGGGSGRRGAAASARGGGGGGGSGGWTELTYNCASLPSLGLTILVAAGGAGGAAVSADSTNGNAGADGGHSTVSLTSGGTILARAWGATGGAGGTTSTAAGGAPVWSSLWTPTSSGASGGTGAGGNANPQQFSHGAGGGGGGVTAADAQAAGGNGGALPIMLGPANAPTAGAAGGGAGAAGATWMERWATGGAGGGGNATGAGGTGGSGGAPGGGGGGGGAGTNGSLSGAGGNGGEGLVRITVHY